MKLAKPIFLLRSTPSTMKTLFIIFLSAIFCLQIIIVQAQNNTFVMTHAQPIDSTRYQNVKGSPYLFPDFVKARIVSNKMEVYEDVILNYNGYSKNFEVKRNGWYMALDGKWYWEVEVLENEKAEKTSLLFQRGLHDKFKNEFVQVCYKGKRILLIKYHYTDMLTKEVQDVGKTVAFKRFYLKSLYYLLDNGTLTLLKNKKKSLLKTLGHSKELDKFMREEKISLSEDQDFAKLIAHYEQLLLDE